MTSQQIIWIAMLRDLLAYCAANGHSATAEVCRELLWREGVR